MFIYYLTKYKWVITLIGLIASLTVVRSHYIGVGYDKAVSEFRGASNEAITKATQKAIIETTKKMQEINRKQQRIFDTEIDRTKNERIVETKYIEVMKYVDKIQIKNECNTIDSSIISLLNNSNIDSSVTRD